MNRLFPIAAIIFTLILLGCKEDFGVSNQKTFEKGVLDLAEYDIENNAPIQLKGEWEFYWSKLLTPDIYQVDPEINPDAYVVLPSYWNDLEQIPEAKNGQGYATYRLRIKNAPVGLQMAIKMRYAMTSSKLWVNNQLLMKSGKIGASEDSGYPEFNPQVKSFTISRSELDIVLQIANYWHAKGGMRQNIILGESSKVALIRDRAVMADIFLIGAMLIMGIYHFSLYFLLRKNRSTLYFGILLLVVCLRVFATNELLILDVFATNWFIQQKLEYITYLSVLPLFLLYTYSLYRKYTYLPIVVAFVGLSVVLIGVVLFTRPIIFSNLATPYQPIVFLGGLYIYYVLFKTLRNGKARALETYIFLSGYTVLFLTVVYDMMYYNFIARTGYMAPYGVFVFIFSQSFLLSRRFAYALKVVEDYNQRLEQKVEERTAELEKKNESLQQLDKEKDSMVDIVAHDLKSPFNSIKGLVEVMKMEKNLTPDQQKYADQIVSLSKDSVGLIHDILDMHAYEYEDFKIKKQRIDLVKFLEHWKERHISALKNKSQPLIIEVPSKTAVLSDSTILGRILDNLITNAMKFSEKGKRIWIKVTKSKEILSIEVKDEGQGINEDDMKLMFKPFQKLSARPTAGESSNGLGLSIIKTLVTKLGGNIHVQSEIGIGSRFILEFPIFLEEN